MSGVRRTLRLAALVASLLLCLLPHLATKVLRIPSPWPKRFLALAARACGTRVSTSGQASCRDVFFVANHLSWLDILVLGGATGTAFISHDDVARWPIVGWLAKQNNTIFVARADRHGVRNQIAQLHTALKNHQPVALFPEGTTGNGQELLPFKPALLAGLMPPPRDLVIQPVYIDYGPATTEIAWYGDEPAGTNMTRILTRKNALPVTLHFLEPFDPEDFADRKAVAEEARKRIAAQQAASVHDCPAV